MASAALYRSSIEDVAATFRQHVSGSDDTECAATGAPPRLDGLGAFRRVRFSPDGSCLMATCDAGIVPIFQLPSSTGSGLPLLHSGQKVINSGEPVIDAVWCPFMSSPTENAAVLVSSRNTPLHLMDAETGGLRASYVAIDEQSDHIQTAHALCWSADEMTDIIAGFEKGVVKVFDVTVEGRVWKMKHKTKYATGIIGSIAASKVDASVPLYAVGSLSTNLVELVDPRTRSCGGVLCGHTSGIIQVLFAEQEKTVFTASRGSSSKVCVWDLRNIVQPVLEVARPTEGQQPAYVTLQRSGNSVRMLAAAADGNIRSASYNSQKTVWSAGPSVKLGDVTHCCGLEVHPNGTSVATCSGYRKYALRDRWAEAAVTDAPGKKRTRDESKCPTVVLSEIEEEAAGSKVDVSFVSVHSLPKSW